MSNTSSATIELISSEFRQNNVTFDVQCCIFCIILLTYTMHCYCRDLTAINASSDEVSSWIESINSECDQNNSSGGARFVESQEATSSGKDSTALIRCSKKENFSFICECFFMTARVLNLGLMKAISDFKHISQVWRYLHFTSVSSYFKSVLLLSSILNNILFLKIILNNIRDVIC